MSASKGASDLNQLHALCQHFTEKTLGSQERDQGFLVPALNAISYFLLLAIHCPKIRVWGNKGFVLSSPSPMISQSAFCWGRYSRPDMSSAPLSLPSGPITSRLREVSEVPFVLR